MTIRKGQILNPSGQNQKKPISEAIRAILSRPVGDALNDKPKTIAQQIALNLVKDALSGDNKLASAKEVMDRVEGKPQQSVDLSAVFKTPEQALGELLNTPQPDTDERS